MAGPKKFRHEDENETRKTMHDAWYGEHKERRATALEREEADIQKRREELTGTVERGLPEWMCVRPDHERVRAENAAWLAAHGQ